MEKITVSTGETKELAAEIATKIKLGDVVALYGDLGTGKTTFTRFLVEALGIKNRVQSPTFIVARRYGNINHVDLYRLATDKDAEDIGIVEMMEDRDSITIIEWPEVIENILPKNVIKIYFEYIEENTRKIKVQNIR